MGQSETEVRDEAVAGYDDAEAMTVARMASGERSIGGSDGELELNRLGFILSSEGQSPPQKHGTLDCHTELYQFGVDLDLAEEVVETAFEGLDILGGRSVETS